MASPATGSATATPRTPQRRTASWVSGYPQALSPRTIAPTVPGDLVTTGIGLVTAIRIWQVFPFDLSSGWSTAVRALLVIAIAGSCVALVVQIVSLARRLTGHTPHMRTGH